MTAITRFFKNLGHDLVDKKLWPVAVALLVGLVAVPMLLAKPAPPTAKGPSAAIGGIAPIDTTVVALGGTPGVGLLQAGSLKDPFVQQHVPVPPAEPVTASTSTVAAGSNSSGSGSTTTVTDNTTTINDNTTTINNNAPKTTKARVRFGRAGVEAPERQVPAGTPLPSTTTPIVIYLGLMPDGKTAQFMVSSDALAQGDGSCVPSPSVCATVSMKAGQTEFFDLPSGSTSKQYQLDYLGPIVS